MTFWMWLAVVSAAFALLERLRPARPAQPVLRRQLGNDLFYLAFNGHFWAVVTGGVATWLASRTDAGLQTLALLPERGALAERHFLVQNRAEFRHLPQKHLPMCKWLRPSLNVPPACCGFKITSSF